MLVVFGGQLFFDCKLQILTEVKNENSDGVKGSKISFLQSNFVDLLWSICFQITIY